MGIRVGSVLFFLLFFFSFECFRSVLGLLFVSFSLFFFLSCLMTEPFRIGTAMYKVENNHVWSALLDLKKSFPKISYHTYTRDLRGMP